MKKGISLIVLVITIIVMIILAAAIIISISNSNVINKANQAVEGTNLQSVKEAAALKFADVTLKMKEAGDDTILGGKTVGAYIQSALVSDGTIPTDEKYIFADSGAVYGVNEYESIDKNTVKDYRYINGTLYYVGTNIENRLALKNNPNINTDYILLYTDSDNNKDGVYKLSDLTGYQTRVNSYKIIQPEGMGENSENTNTGGSDLTLRTGTTLYLGQNYANELATVLIFGDIFFEGRISTTASYWLYAEGENVIPQIIITGMDSTAIMTLIGDVDMDGNINGEKDGQLLFYIADEFENGRLYTQNIRKWQ